MSDTVLAYAADGRNGYLLITILYAPHAHSTARMETKETGELMHQLAEIADQFIFYGTWDV